MGSSSMPGGSTPVSSASMMSGQFHCRLFLVNAVQFLVLLPGVRSGKGSRLANSAGDAASSHPVAEGYVRRATKELGVKQEEKWVLLHSLNLAWSLLVSQGSALVLNAFGTSLKDVEEVGG